jgi:hypothetical protein
MNDCSDKPAPIVIGCGEPFDIDQALSKIKKAIMMGEPFILVTPAKISPATEIFIAGCNFEELESDLNESQKHIIECLKLDDLVSCYLEERPLPEFGPVRNDLRKPSKPAKQIVFYRKFDRRGRSPRRKINLKC